ncbi:MAG: DNA polymerase I [Myxococcales bacterium]
MKYPQYKAQRPPLPEELLRQLPHIDRVVQANRFPVLRAEGYEADDVIGTLARRGAAAGMEVVIVAGDKDFAQLVGGQVRMFDPMREVTYDPELVFKKWGVRPDQMADLLALMGDDTDNIPGVDGIGHKGACALLAKYGSVDGVYAHLDELKGAVKTKLEAGKQSALLSRELAIIETDAPVAPDLEALRLDPPDPMVLDTLYRELEFNSLLTGGPASGTATAAAARVQVCDTPELAKAVLAELRGREVAVAPLIDPPTAEHPGLVGLALAVPGGQPCYLPFAGEGGTVLGGAGYDLLRGWLADPEATKVAHDVKELWKACRRHGLELQGARLDTMLLSFLAEPTRCVPHRLEQVAREYLQQTVPSRKSVTGSGQKELLLRQVPVAAAASYAGALAAQVAALAPILSERVGKLGLEEHYRTHELPLALVLGQMELDGIKVDRADLKVMGVELRERKAALEARIHALAGHEFNVGSNAQLATVLFEELKLPVVKKTKTGYSTDADVLERLAPKHEIAKAVLDQRSLAKLINTYTDVLQDAVSPLTGRIHATFQQTVGVSGRLISTDPDLQRTPVRTPEGKRIRQAFIAEPGNRIISADWSRIELRVLAHFSRDPALLDSFRRGLDVHRRTASELFHVGFEEVTAEQRGVGKTINFATVYGQGATALSQILGIERKEAQRYIEHYFETYSGVREWLDETIAAAKACGYVTTLLGRRRWIPELSSHSPMDEQAGERIAANTPIQGSAADLCKLAMLRVAKGLRDKALKAKLLLQVHDELVLEVPEPEVEEVSALVRDAMEQPSAPEVPLEVPLVVNLGVGRSWGEAH